MKIESIGLSLPSREVSNEEIIDLIRYNSKHTFLGDLEKALRKVRVILKKTGAENRLWLNKQINEKPIDHIKIAVDDALKQANLAKNDIDVLIYVGIGKGFLEPAQSYFVAKALGMDGVRCFDITDACMSWMTGMQMLDALFKTGSCKKAMIVNAEFTVNAGPLFKNFSLQSEAQLEYTFPTFTIGEASTCTIVSHDINDNFLFNFISRSDLADLCVIPTPDYKYYSIDTDKLAMNGVMHFTSFGADLHNYGMSDCLKVVKDNNVDIVFTHASSKSEWQRFANEVGLGEKIYHIYQDTGNLVSASIPASIKIALNNNKISKGNKILCWVGSAGMSFGSAKFVL